MPPPWSTSTALPYPPRSPAAVTVPDAAATTGPGTGRETRSTPACSLHSWWIGWNRIPNTEVRTYACWNGGRQCPLAATVVVQSRRCCSATAGAMTAARTTAAPSGPASRTAARAAITHPIRLLLSICNSFLS